MLNSFCIILKFVQCCCYFVHKTDPLYLQFLIYAFYGFIHCDVNSFIIFFSPCAYMIIGRIKS